MNCVLMLLARREFELIKIAQMTKRVKAAQTNFFSSSTFRLENIEKVHFYHFFLLPGNGRHCKCKLPMKRHQLIEITTKNTEI